MTEYRDVDFGTAAAFTSIVPYALENYNVRINVGLLQDKEGNVVRVAPLPNTPATRALTLMLAEWNVGRKLKQNYVRQLIRATRGDVHLASFAAHLKRMLALTLVGADDDEDELREVLRQSTARFRLVLEDSKLQRCTLK